MKNPGLPEILWQQLAGRLWHATDRIGLNGIISDGEIKVAFGSRYRGAFCRHQDSVSLFDFGPAAVDIPGQFSNWSGWFGAQQEAAISIWLEIDRASVLRSLSDAGDTRLAWNTSMDLRGIEDATLKPGILFIPGVEACHKGPVPLAAISDIMVVARHDKNRFLHLRSHSNDLNRDVDAFEASLIPHEENQVVEILRARRLTNAEGNN
jgi:hypothetical protein